ncbi:MAG TPA: hypothetical protein VFS29_05545, partial [Motilibacteraceae bacterium]|nr:hypothetical protein [Motilibacteraceae bacterium]
MTALPALAPAPPAPARSPERSPRSDGAERPDGFADHLDRAQQDAPVSGRDRDDRGGRRSAERSERAERSEPSERPEQRAAHAAARREGHARADHLDRDKDEPRTSDHPGAA